ncbi:MAG: NADH-quinone oxidoreductase subunit K [Thermoplasmata archaeon]|nr:NADH-quinone oxidoreductase subunit K [Thermoplasmata archaeon]
MIYNIPYIAVIILIMVGLYAVVFKRNIIKMVMGITIIESGVNLFLVTLGYRAGGVAPIFTNLPEERQIPGQLVLPIPQALTLTSIVIGVAVLALMLALAIQIYRQYKTLDVTKIRRLKE